MERSPAAQPTVVREARAAIHEMDSETVAEQLRIVAIPAPTGAEAERAAHVARRFRERGLADVRVDEVGNVLGRLPGEAAGAPVIVSAHLDTVFGPDVAIEPRRDGSRIWAPGITDNARGLTALVTLATVMARHPLPLLHPVHFVATVGEEGLGDLRGARHLFRSGGPFSHAAAFVALDGSGLRRLVHRAIGCHRLRATVTGPGGHSWSDWGAPNPVHAVGEAISALDTRISLPEEPPVTLTVARTGGGTSINSIPASAWLEIDIRSGSPTHLERCALECRTLILEAVAAANERRRPGTGRLTADVEVIGERPAGSLAADAPLVIAAQRATRAVGARPELVASSTDANVPLSMGIPALTLGAGGRSGGVHTLGEWYDNRAGALGIERALLLIVDLAGDAPAR